MRYVSPDGSITLQRGDSRKLLRELPDASIDLIFTDPPYGHNNNNGDLASNTELATGRKTENGPPRPILNDDPASAAELIDLLATESARILRCCCCCCCCCCGGGGPDPQFARWALTLDQSLHFQQMVIWDKGKMGLGWKYRRSYETVLVASNGPKMSWHTEQRTIENIIRPGDYGIRKRIPRANEHPTPKPIELPQHFIRLHSQPGELVLDPFLGGGSTAVAAVREGRRFLGFEVDPQWFDLAVARVESALLEREQVAPSDSSPPLTDSR